ncbi:hypothetical protein RF11_09581 [Thelohanellus kitauei]|uniref:Uncharacterized protein n=1 Tax=Thelohanellus kitauei TaxID=669202 RepID=A0A0C2MD83_THEKT|nr:hypothetical protein RF11_09581 [Thelohanellus kitauei]
MIITLATQLAVRPNNHVCLNAIIYSSAVTGIISVMRIPLYTIYRDPANVFDRVRYALINILEGHIIRKRVVIANWIRLSLRSIYSFIPTSIDPSEAVIFRFRLDVLQGALL